MKKTIMFMSLLLVATNLFAQESFHLVSYTPPANWVAEKNEQVIVYGKEDKQSGSYCTLVIYTVMPGKGGGIKDFDFAWKNLVEKPFAVNATPDMMSPGKTKGWDLLAGHAQYDNKGVTSLAMLFTFSGENKMQAVCIVSNSQQYKKEVEEFIASIDVVNDISSSSSLQAGDSAANSKSKKTAAAANPPANKDNDKTEIWMNVQTNPGYGVNSWKDLTVKFYVVYANGDYYPHFPTTGLAKLNNRHKENDSWGVFTMSGNKGKFKSKYETINVEKVSVTEMKKIGYTFSFYKCVKVDGLKLEGAWSYIPDWTKDPYYSQAGCRQVIYFKKDGTFDDRGVFVSDCRYPQKNPEDAPGKGKYSISNFTITFKYEDGRTVYKAFTGVSNKNPATHNEVIYIGTHPFFSK